MRDNPRFEPSPTELYIYCPFCSKKEPLTEIGTQTLIIYVLWLNDSGELRYSRTVTDFVKDMPAGYRENIEQNITDGRMLTLCSDCIKRLAHLPV